MSRIFQDSETGEHYTNLNRPVLGECGNYYDGLDYSVYRIVSITENTSYGAWRDRYRCVMEKVQSGPANCQEMRRLNHTQG